MNGKNLKIMIDNIKQMKNWIIIECCKAKNSKEEKEPNRRLLTLRIVEEAFIKKLKEIKNQRSIIIRMGKHKTSWIKL